MHSTSTVSGSSQCMTWAALMICWQLHTDHRSGKSSAEHVQRYGCQKKFPQCAFWEQACKELMNQSNTHSFAESRTRKRCRRLHFMPPHHMHAPSLNQPHTMSMTVQDKRHNQQRTGLEAWQCRRDRCPCQPSLQLSGGLVGPESLPGSSRVQEAGSWALG